MTSRNRLHSGTLGLALTAALCAPLAAQSPRAPDAAANSALGFEVGDLDRGVRPQDDFFRFANGGWLDRTEIPTDLGRFGSFDDLGERSRQALRVLIEEAAASPDAKPGTDLQKVGDLYRSYMDTVAIEMLALKPVQPELDRIIALSDRRELPELFADFARSGVLSPVGFGVGQDAKQTTRYIAYAGQSGLGLPDRDYYLKDDGTFPEIRSAYRDYIVGLFRLADQPNPEEAAKNIISLETRLAEKQWDRVRNRDRDATYNLKTTAELRQLTPAFDWARYLERVGAEATPAVVVNQPDYFEALDLILSETPLPVLKQYLAFKVLDSAAAALSKPFRDARFAFRGQMLSGLKEESPRWKLAVNAVDAVLGEASGRLYVERHFTPDQKARMQVLVGNLLAAFKAGIDELEWMSPATKAQAQAKLASFTVKIGYPDKWKDYSNLEIRPGDLLGNLRRGSNWAWEDMVGRLGKPIDRGLWGMTPPTVNAYYSSMMNEIVFPAAILQPPFFNPEADDAANYGAIGAVIGHEISHGFDDQGARADGQGNLRDWWTEQDQREFAARTGALATLYSGFEPLPGQPINGKLTLGENIGDLSGVTVAYKAYQRSLGGKQAPVIGGFTGDQRFFLGFAQMWRTKHRDETLRQRLLTDPHSPGEFRTNGVLRNVPEFYAAFEVEEGDRMYLPPAQRVKIW